MWHHLQPRLPSQSLLQPQHYFLENNAGAAKDSATEVVAASDATFTIDGIAITRSTNTITDLFSGITVDLDDVSASELGNNQTIGAR